MKETGKEKTGFPKKKKKRQSSKAEVQTHWARAHVVKVSHAPEAGGTGWNTASPGHLG